MKMDDPHQSAFSDRPLYDDSIDNEPCPNCHRKYSDHSTGQAVKCALAIIKGGDG